MSRVYGADWIVPIDAPPIRNGWVEIHRGRIVAIGSEPRVVREAIAATDSEPRTSNPEPSTTNHERRTVVLPGLVNAHTHLELSWMQGLVPPGDAMPSWAARLIAERSESERTHAVDQRRDAAVRAIEAARASGTVLVGDVTNALEAWGPLADSALSAAVFYELLGFRAEDPTAVVKAAKERLSHLPPGERLRAVVVPHAPYSVSPALFGAIAASADGAPISVHLGESPEEVRFLRDGRGPWRDLLERLGAWTPDWVPPGCGPVEYMGRLGLLNDRLIAVHGVQFSDEELGQLANSGATLVTCPRSNKWTGAGIAPVQRFFASGVRVAIGTDSLASVEDLNMFNELAEVRRQAPDVAAAEILKSATLNGAIALGFGGELGSISPGKRAQLLQVSIPAGVENVEEYLVGGIPDAVITWLIDEPEP
jgi:cytosine/adenosine deaminase-related metal-dependent hydrolase